MSLSTCTSDHPKRPDHDQSRYVYRLLRAYEFPGQGLAPKSSLATVTMEDHVANGSKFGHTSQYISACKTEEAVKRFASKTNDLPPSPSFRCIVRIDLQKLNQERPNIKIKDISNVNDARVHMPCTDAGLMDVNKNAIKLAAYLEEVLIEGVVPASCVSPHLGATKTRDAAGKLRTGFRYLTIAKKDSVHMNITRRCNSIGTSLQLV